MSTDVFQPDTFQGVIGNGTAFQVFDSFTPIPSRSPFYVPRPAEVQFWEWHPLSQPLTLHPRSISLTAASKALSFGLGFPAGKLPILAHAQSVTEGKSSPSGALPLSAHASGAAKALSSLVGKLLTLSRSPFFAPRPAEVQFWQGHPLSQPLTLFPTSISLTAVSKILSSSALSILSTANTIPLARFFVTRPGEVGLWQGRPQGQPLTLLTGVAVSLAAIAKVLSHGFGSTTGKLPVLAHAQYISEGKSSPSGNITLSARTSGLARGNAAPAIALALAARLYESARGFASAVGKLPLLAHSQSIAEGKSSAPSGKLPLSARASGLMRGLALPSGKTAISALSSIISSASGALSAATYTILRARLFAPRQGDVGLWQGRPQGQPLTLLTSGAIGLMALAKTLSRGLGSPAGKLPLLGRTISKSQNRGTIVGSTALSALSASRSAMRGTGIVRGALHAMMDAVSNGRSLLTGRVPISASAAVQTAQLGKLGVALRIAGASALRVVTSSPLKAVVSLFARSAGQLKAPSQATYRSVLAAKSSIVSYGKAAASATLALAGSGTIIAASRGAIVFAGSKIGLLARAAINIFANIGNRASTESILGRPVSGVGGADEVSSSGPGKTNT